MRMTDGDRNQPTERSEGRWNEIGVVVGGGRIEPKTIDRNRDDD